ncbi:hypothetical protein Tco_1155145 [Tanacetum coccineum]
MNVPVPLDHFPVNALTSKVFSFMVKKGKHFSGKVTPLFASMLVQPTEDEGATSERPSEPQPTPSPPHPSEANVEPQTDPSPRPSPSTHIPDSIPESSGGNHGGQSSSDKSLSGNEGDMTLQSVYDLCISLCTQQRLAGKKTLKANWMQKESVSKQGRKSAKAEPSVHTNPLFDELPDDTMDYMDTEDAQDVGRTIEVVNEEKEAQRRFLVEQRAIAIRNNSPTRTQHKNQMMTYLKHVGNKKHSDLKSKTFEEIQALYEKVKRFDESFTVVGSTEDERRIKEMNEGVKDTDQKRLKEEDIEKVPAKVEVTEQGTLDSEIMEKKSVIARLDKVSSPDGDYLVIYRANGNFRAFNYLMEVLHIFDRQDLFHLYELMMEQYSEITLEGFELILWGDLKIMMESSTEENDQSDFWSNQQDWKIITWRLYEACGVCILELEDGIVIHMLVEEDIFY